MNIHPPPQISQGSPTRFQPLKVFSPTLLNPNLNPQHQRTQPHSTTPPKSHPIYFSPSRHPLAAPCYQEVAALLPSQSPPILPLKVWLVPRAHEDPAWKNGPLRCQGVVVSGEPFIRGNLVAYIIHPIGKDYKWYISGIIPANWVMIYHRSHLLWEPETAIDDEWLVTHCSSYGFKGPSLTAVSPPVK